MYLSMFAIDLFLYGCKIPYVVFFFSFALGTSRLEILMLHCNCPAETDQDRAQTKTEGFSL